ncbi:TRAP transporter small permease [Aquimarina sp. 433]
MIRKIEKVLGVFLKSGVFLSTMGFLTSTLVQIYSRFFMEKAPSWTEEAARLCFVFAIAFSSGLAMKSNFYVYFDFLFQKLPKNWQHRLTIGIYACIIILFMIFSVYGVLWVKSGLQEQSPSMKFPMAIAFISMPLLGLTITFYTIIKIIRILKIKKK